jgi:ligand-binding sensor domain-containing protein
VYAATGNGLFYSFNSGTQYKRIFQGKNIFENECTALAILPSGIYLGTKGGLFVSKDRGRSWYRESGKLGNSCVLTIASSLKEANCIYVACVDGVFKTKDSGKNWEKVFSTHPTEDGIEIEEPAEDQDEGERYSKIRYIAFTPNNLNELFLATTGGIYRSIDSGLTWNMLSDYGLLSKDVQFLLLTDKSRIYAVTKSGIFEFINERWQELSLGLLAEAFNSLTVDSQNNLYVATNRGLFKADISYTGASRENDTIAFYAKSEPKINEIQQAAIKYAEVEPEKIIQWRKQAAKKALLPELTMGVNRDTADLWHWEGGSTTKTDDDTLRRGHDSIEWDVTLKWDLSELIWNEDQTNIDVRSRLLVQLRDDILDEVTKLYFERIRVRMELDSLSIEDRRKRFDKELRLKELTASIDALTGGYFSAAIKEKSRI